MENNIWLISVKASLGIESSMNFDGSEYVTAIGVVQANDITDSIPKLEAFLKSDHMDIMDVWKCERYEAANFQDDSEDSREIRKAVNFVLDRGEPVLACGVTSDAMDEGSTDD